jgi:hypothetical protein
VSGALKKPILALQSLVEKGDLSPDKVSVKARMSLSELAARLGKIVTELQNLLPSTDKEVRTCGYSKWHMGAVLVEEGFTEHAVLSYCRALLKVLRVQALDDVADKQILDQIEYFGKKFDIFCSVLADLGLMAVCEKATEVLHAELLEETKNANESAKILQREKLNASQHSAGTTKKTKLDMSRFSSFKSPQKNTIVEESPASPRKSPLDKSRFVAFNSPGLETSPKKSPSNDSLKKSPTTPKSRVASLKKVPMKPLVFDDESSYETIEEVITVSSYETVEREDDSSYETVEEIEALSEYETDE